MYCGAAGIHSALTPRAPLGSLKEEWCYFVSGVSMRVRRLSVVLVFIASLFSFSVAGAAPVSFVENDEQLNAALEVAERGTIGSVAIKQDFYRTSAKQTKDRVRGLIARTFELGDRSVYIYNDSASVDQGLAGELLAMSPPCPSGFFLGKFMPIHGNEFTSSCWSGRGDASSAGNVREAILHYERWRRE